MQFINRETELKFLEEQYKKRILTLLLFTAEEESVKPL